MRIDFPSTRKVPVGIVLALSFLLVAVGATHAQDRDVRGERLVLDDGAGDGGLNTLIIRVPAGGLSSSRTLTFPDADGSVVTGSPAGLNPNQILFGDGTGLAAQSPNLIWNNGGGVFDIGSGNFIVDAASGNVATTGTLTLGSDAPVASGFINFNDGDGGTSFLGTLTPVGVLTANRTYFLPDADGTLALVGNIVTDASLTGDGSGGSPLAIDLTNGNNWTGAQTFSSVDINGGSVDGTAIGAASPSTGAFTTITGGSTVTLGDDLFPTRGRVILHDNLDLNSFLGTLQTASILTGNRTYTLPDASGTLVVSGTETVFSDATITGDGSSGSPLGIDLTNANSWTGAQTFSSVDINGGSVDGTAIGAASPSTGAFTTITGGSTVTLGDDLFPTRGRVILHDNLDLNGFQGTLQTASVLTGNRTYTLPDADGTLALVGNIVTDASLTGDGSGGSPLGIDLTNANSWTGAQTFSSVDINGGSVDGTAIGAASPSTGAFTTITGGSTVTLGDDLFPTRGRVILHDNLDLNGFQGTLQTASILTGNRTYTLPDASGTLVVSGTETVFSDATITGDGSSGSPLGIDLTNANSWTGAQTFSSVDINGGSVDGTAIGAASPSTGAFTTITGGSTVTLGDDLFPTRGRVILHDNLDLNSFQGTLQTASVLTGNRTYTLPDASGTIAFLSDIAVTTNSTLLGDGTGGDPLRFNLSNTNTWTGTQTFGQVAVLSIATFDADVTLGDSPTDAITANGTFAGATPLSFEGSTSDVNETTFAITDPTADRTITFPDASGTVAFLSDIAVTTNSTLLGDGTGGDPLRFNLSNTNTWTGTQTFGQVAVLSIATFDADVTLGDSPTDAITANGTFAGATPLSFEGSTSDVNETTFAITDPTADRTITFPDASGTVAFLSDIAVTTNSTLLGDGTGGDPLRINLSNTNTWTGTQTFGQVAVLSIATFDADVTLGDSPTDAITANGTFAGATPLSFEGSTSDVNETTFAITDPTADRTITFPDASGTVAFLSDIAVTTNSTLLGDGTGGDPLRFNLTNANSWTGAQTFSNVDINGGSVDGTAIGAASPSTGAFTTITGGSTVTLGDDLFPTRGRVILHDNLDLNGFQGTLQTASILTGNRTYTLPDASGTLVVAGSETVSTDATLAGDGSSGLPLGIDLTNANSWTGAQTFSSVDINGGSVDGTAIGAASPSTGAFTTITGGSTVTLGDDLFPTRGRVILHDNLDLNGFQGTLQTASILTGNRTYTLPDATGTLALLNAANNWTSAQTFSSVDINGGSVDGTAIGAASPSTGAFTTITGGSTVTLGDDLFPTRGRVILHDNLDLNGFVGTLQTANVLTGNRTYTLPDADGTFVISGTETVSSDATLTGDGSGGSPLGIDLTNANSWTGAQTFSSVDVDGGTIDGTAIGATTPSSGVFTSVSGNSGVFTSATVTSGLFTTIDINGGTIDGTTIGGAVQAPASVTALVATGTSDLRGAVSNSTGTLTLDDDVAVTGASGLGNGDAGDIVTVNTGGNTDLVLSESGVDRNSGSAETFAVDNSGAGDVSVLINGATAVTNSRIVVRDGHWTSQGTAPTAAGDGVNLAALATVSGTSTDVAGQVTATDLAAAAGVGVITVTFADAYNTDPIVVVTAGDQNAQTAGFFVNNITTTTFDINIVAVVGGGGGTTYTFYYQVIEND